MENFLENILFFGSINNWVYLKSVESQYYDVKENKIEQEISDHTLFLTLINRFPQDFLGKDYKNLYIPCTPAHNLSLKVKKFKKKILYYS